MQTEKVIDHIANWLKEYAFTSGTNGYVVGVSGGIDSAVTSTLCALSGMPLVVVEMPIHQAQSQVSRAHEHCEWLKSRFDHVRGEHIEMTAVYDGFMSVLPVSTEGEHIRNLSMANTRARLRMTALYYVAGINRMLVAGTGNKIEDFGVGFFTKYGDGGVDLSPIADLTKTEVYEIARHLGIAGSIQNAAPTDGLWGDDRTDEDQIGASYPELEWAMDHVDRILKKKGKFSMDLAENDHLDGRERRVLEIYWRMNRANQHKMLPIPVCNIPSEFK